VWAGRSPRNLTTYRDSTLQLRLSADHHGILAGRHLREDVVELRVDELCRKLRGDWDVDFAARPCSLDPARVSRDGGLAQLIDVGTGDGPQPGRGGAHLCKEAACRAEVWFLGHEIDQRIEYFVERPVLRGQFQSPAPPRGNGVTMTTPRRS